METWLIFALASILFAGLQNFGAKIIAKRNYNVSFVSIYTYIFSALFSIIYYLVSDFGNWSLDGWRLILLFGFGNTLFYFLSLLSRVESMRNIDTTIFFPLYKTFSPIIITLISLFWFNESLSIKEVTGIILGICVPLLLISKSENKIQTNLKKGIVFVIFTSIFASIASGIAKNTQVYNLNISLFTSISLVWGAIISSMSYKLTHKKAKIEHNKKGVYEFGAILGVFHFISAYTFFRALEGNLAVVFTLNSFSILIPILLSVIFYKEHMTYKKGFVVVLSIVSAWLFI